jgi:hypothetical protein
MPTISTKVTRNYNKPPSVCNNEKQHFLLQILLRQSEHVCISIKITTYYSNKNLMIEALVKKTNIKDTYRPTLLDPFYISNLMQPNYLTQI